MVVLQLYAVKCMHACIVIVMNNSDIQAHINVHVDKHFNPHTLKNTDTYTHL